MAFGICLFLGFIVWTVFGQTLGFDFVNYDDGKYVYENPHVIAGLTWEGVRWAATYGEIGHWHPLTWISHMLDCQLYGLWPGGHHLTNVLIHGATVLGLFLLLRALTGSLWRSAFVVSIWAIHPLRTESVVWVAERKDVLSGLFFVLTLGAYVRYTRHSKRIEISHNSRLQEKGGGAYALSWVLQPGYWLVFILFALGLLAKNMLVTVPCLLLLLDYWPLCRTETILLPNLLIEKLPLFALSLTSCLITLLVPEHLESTAGIPLALRLENVAVSYVIYLWQTIWPANLALPYPNPQHLFPLATVIGSLVILTALSTSSVVLRKKWPAFFVGWFWFIGMLIPVIGLVQISNYACADRYTYLPQIGMLVALVWVTSDLKIVPRWVFGLLAMPLIGGLMTEAKIQTSYWHDSETLWNHTIASTENNAVAHNNLGSVLLQKGQINEATVHYEEALKSKPDYADALCNLGGVLLQKGEPGEAINRYQEALKANPENLEALCNLGGVFLQEGQPDQAITYCELALKIDPTSASAHNNLGGALMQKGQLEEATIHFQLALKTKPDYADAHCNLANALVQQGKLSAGIEQYRQGLNIEPNSVPACNNLAFLLATCSDPQLRNGLNAEKLARRAAQITGNHNPVILSTLAAAYSEQGRFAEAASTIQQALQLADAQGNSNLHTTLEQQLELYQNGQPLRSSP